MPLKSYRRNTFLLFFNLFPFLLTAIRYQLTAFSNIDNHLIFYQTK